MHKVLSSLLMACAATLSACAPMQQAQPLAYPPFPTEEYAKLPRTGDAQVSGQAFMKTRGGDVKVGAGSEIVLIPVTSYSKVLYTAYLSNRPINTPDARAREFTIRTQADATGSFIFTGVPAGTYYLGGEVTWEAPTQYGLSKQGGFIAKEVTVAPGSKNTFMLTK